MAKSSGSQPKQKPVSSAANTAASGLRPRRRLVYVTVIFLVIIVVGVSAIYALSQEDTEPSSTESNLAATLSATNVPPTEAPQEVALQQQLRDWALTMEGVTQVSTLDIDIPENEPPLIYAELEVEAGYNNQSIPNLLITKVNEVLNVTQYSDVTVIINDGTQIIEYTLNPENNTWNQTVLSTN
jgi:hypothetical protein